jgi:predicted negative regulator of RcsB-dependent stress response
MFASSQYSLLSSGTERSDTNSDERSEERASVSAQYERSEYGVIGTMSAANSDEQI